uniref:Bromo domain-containing protein n=1 Tax=Panagrolaimus sp. JU765 TaxID=591449 RepID=A0AC34QEX7_9BILA
MQFSNRPTHFMPYGPPQNQPPFMFFFVPHPTLMPVPKRMPNRTADVKEKSNVSSSDSSPDSSILIENDSIEPASSPGSNVTKEDVLYRFQASKKNREVEKNDEDSSRPSTAEDSSRPDTPSSGCASPLTEQERRRKLGPVFHPRFLGIASILDKPSCLNGEIPSEDDAPKLTDYNFSQKTVPPSIDEHLLMMANNCRKFNEPDLNADVAVKMVAIMGTKRMMNALNL